MPAPDPPYVSRGALKLAHALEAFGLDPAGRVCADLGCSTGGFTDVLLRRGAAKLYAVDTGYGVLDWRLRNDPRVVVMERTNAMHVELPEPVSLVTIDAGWTRQSAILPHARSLLAPGGEIITLVKPHYEAGPASVRRTRGVVDEESLADILKQVRRDIAASGFVIVAETPSPIRGSAGRNARGNIEFLMHLITA
jgi:23S rRNA (cytidine1920-2'-O)/16S rRNA (cytidine1409-2'-O)-methyltransferase